MKLRVSRVREVSNEVRSFELRALEGEALPPFTAGAHLTLSLPLNGGVAAERHYSIVSNPTDSDGYEIAVLLDPESRGGSRYMHQAVVAGTVLVASPPLNDFRLVEGAQRSILIAGGIGITPILAMLRTLVASGADVEVHYAAAEPERLA